MTEPYEPTYSQRQLLKDLVDYPQDYTLENARFLDPSTLQDLRVLAFHELTVPFYASRIEPCTTEDLFTSNVPLDSSQEERDDFARFTEKSDEYFSDFIKPVFNEGGDRICHCCGTFLNGLMSHLQIGGGGFRWGIQHGEGFCDKCKWPMRAYHNPKDKDDPSSTLFDLRSLPLAYLPDTASARAEREAAAAAAAANAPATPPAD